MTVTVLLQNADDESPSTADFQRWVNHALIHVSTEIPSAVTEMTVRIVDENESAQLNEEFRKKTGPTNILSFYYDPMPGFEHESLGDLAICKNIVINEAKLAQKSTLAHWAHLTVHGVLHLLRFDHENDEEAKVMESLEIEILNKLGFANPYLDPEQGKIHD